MGIDQCKSPKLLAAIMVALATPVSGCVTPPDLDVQPTPLSLISKLPTVTPPRCPVSAEAIRPSSLDRESVVTYPGGIVVNQAGGVADVRVDPIHLIRINNDPALGLSLPGYRHVIYFFHGDFRRPDAISQINRFFYAQKDYLFARYCEQQGSDVTHALLVSLSITDNIRWVNEKYPALRPGSRSWIVLLEERLNSYYMETTRFMIDRDLNRPTTTLSDDAIDRALAGGLPFRISRLTLAANPS